MYEPGKRHWLKMKKDYLAGGAMADTADLIVLGAYYGTGNKGIYILHCVNSRMLINTASVVYLELLYVQQCGRHIAKLLLDGKIARLNQ